MVLEHSTGPGINQCLYLLKAELDNKTNPNGHHFLAVWVRFGVQLDYSCRLKSVLSDAENRLDRLMRNQLVPVYYWLI